MILPLAFSPKAAASSILFTSITSAITPLLEVPIEPPRAQTAMSTFFPLETK